MWWQCSKCSHEWEATISNRIRGNSKGSGCPVCNLKGLPSFPERVISYYFGQFIEIKTQHKLSKSKMLLDIYIPSLKVGIEYDGKWSHENVERDIKKDALCKELGISLYRIREVGCPKLNSSSVVYEVIPKDYNNLQEIVELLILILLGKTVKVDIERDRIKIEELNRKDFKENSFEVKSPDLIKEWHPIKNGLLKPSNFSHKSNSKAWWLCSKCSYEWEALISSRSSGRGCPACSNKVVTSQNNLTVTHPHLTKEWHTDKNELSPGQVVSGSHIKVWWQCKKCPHEWEAIINDRSRGSGCPECSKKKRVETRRKKKLLKKQLLPLLNTILNSKQ